jgi:hypothetical protein
MGVPLPAWRPRLEAGAAWRVRVGDLIHNFGDALTALPLGIAFYLRSFRGEKLAGLAVVLAISSRRA